MDSVAGSLDRLGVDHIDLYQIHMSDPLTPEEETLRALDDLVSQHLVRYIGGSNWPDRRIAKALGISAHHGWAKFDTVQAYYSITGRDLEREIVPMMADQKVGLLVWCRSPAGFCQANSMRRRNRPMRAVHRWIFRLSSRNEPGPASRRCAASRETTSVACVAVNSIIIGAKTIEQLNDNLGASALELSAAELASLDAISELSPEYPGWCL